MKIRKEHIQTLGIALFLFLVLSVMVFHQKDSSNSGVPINAELKERELTDRGVTISAVNFAYGLGRTYTEETDRVTLLKLTLSLIGSFVVFFLLLKYEETK